jgi:RNA polymerase sigma-70 factor, ECF subfamily
MKIGDEIAGPVKAAWHLFIERTAPLRPDLYRYCRSLTGSVWDAEDLVQDTLLKAFARLSEAAETVENVRAYIFRIASNLWIDKFRSTRELVTDVLPAAVQPETPSLSEIGDAAKHLLMHLPPVERAALLLKDVFDLSLEETATALDSTVGAVKAALHRGRAKLSEIQEELALPRSVDGGPLTALVERFVEAFNARDVNRLVALMREDATSEMLGMVLEYGREAIGKNKKGVLRHTFASHPSKDTFRAELRDYRGEAIVLFWTKDAGHEVVSSIGKIDEREGTIARLRHYFFCPELLAEVCGELGVPVKTNGYRPSWN